MAFKAGKIIHAQLGAARGLKAIYRMLAWTEASFEVMALREVQEDEGIPGRIENILLESARQKDEIDRLEKKTLLLGKTLYANPDASPQTPIQQDVIPVAKNGIDMKSLLDRVPYPDLDVYQAVLSLIEKGHLKTEG